MDQIKDHIATYRKLIDAELEAGHMSYYLVLFVYQQLLEDKIRVEVGTGVVDNSVFDIDTLKTPISALKLSVRATNCLERERIQCVGHLVLRTEDNITSMRHSGETVLGEVKEALKSRGLALGMKLPPRVLAAINPPG